MICSWRCPGSCNFGDKCSLPIVSGCSIPAVFSSPFSSGQRSQMAAASMGTLLWLSHGRVLLWRQISQAPGNSLDSLAWGVDIAAAGGKSAAWWQFRREHHSPRVSSGQGRIRSKISNVVCACIRKDQCAGARVNSSEAHQSHRLK